jgi:hypothetical protein
MLLGIVVLFVLWFADLVECLARWVKAWVEDYVRRVDEAVKR